MVRTKAKTLIVVGAGLLFAAGITTIILKKTVSPPVDDSFWENLSAENLKNAPPALIIRPTHFPGSSGFSTSVFDSRFAGRNVSLIDALEYAYVLPYTQMILPEELQVPVGETKRCDFLVSVANQPRKRFQAEIKSKFGLTSRREMRKTDVLLLTLKNPNAPGLKLDSVNAYPLTNYVWMVSEFFGKPVIDQTGLTGNYEFSPPLPRYGREAGMEAFRKALLDQLGLELVPTNMPIEMLVVEKAK